MVKVGDEDLSEKSDQTIAEIGVKRVIVASARTDVAGAAGFILSSRRAERRVLSG